MTRKITRSTELYERARKVTPGGVHSNARFAIHSPHPIYMKRAQGSLIWDVDGNEYIDCLGNLGALILGHGDAGIRAAVERALDSGLTAAVDSELEIEATELLVSLLPNAESARFCNSGTEAVKHAITIARGVTGRQKIVKTVGNYHGHYDFVYCGFRPEPSQWDTGPQAVPAGRGVSDAVRTDTFVIPWNDSDALAAVLEQYGSEIAAVILEPVSFNVGCALPKPGYLEQVRELTTRAGALLIFDEVITGFRPAPGGAQEHFGVTADLTTYGKAIANGYPIAAVAGPAEIFDQIDPGTPDSIGFGGTYNGHTIPVAATLESLKRLAGGDVQRHLVAMTDKLVTGFNERAQNLGVAARMQGFAGKFAVYFLDHEVVDWQTAYATNREQFAVFSLVMREQGILWSAAPWTHHGITAAHGDAEIDRILTAAEKALEQVRQETP